jgi:hypothetical protein
MFVKIPLNISLPSEKFAEVAAGTRKEIATKKNPRKDRYFLAKIPQHARIKELGTDRSFLHRIFRVEETADEWRIVLC